ncbi:MAG: retroviral-like aspartic protease family protein [Candidatus Omnitrophica bacterium]|nr:retroviral-like aspartic protease family protein [Candidatus Omnitrophota bacterium]
MNPKILIPISFLLFGLVSGSLADTIYLKNGRSIEGLIAKEDNETVELDVGFGTVKFRKTEIDNIDRSSPEQVSSIRKGWKEQKEVEEKRRSERARELEEERRREELEPKEVSFSKDSQRIVVDALINNKINASLLLDTGATTVVLSNRIAEELRIDRGSSDKEDIEVQLADGRKIEARYVVLDSVRVEDAEVKDVGAVILLDAEEDIEDGLLGMSFLNKFNFQIDTLNNKLVLQKRK